MCIPGASGAGKSTLERALSRQVQLPVYRRDDEPDVRQLVEPELGVFCPTPQKGIFGGLECEMLQDWNPS